MSSASPVTPRFRPRTGIAWPLTLSRAASRRMIVLLALLLSLAGVAAGLATLLAPAPQPLFVGAWLSGNAKTWSLWETAAQRDREALAASGAFQKWHELGTPAPTGQQLLDHLAPLRHASHDEPVVLYLAARAVLSDTGTLHLLLGGQHSHESIALHDLLSELQVCRARRKWLILDLTPAELAPWTATADELWNQAQDELAGVDDPDRLTLCNIGPGLVSTTWQRTPLGYYLEQALAGAADGWHNGRYDGRVTVLEASSYVMHQVRHWSQSLAGSDHAPELVGTGSDFDLVAFSLRNGRKASPEVDLAPAAYPPWLIAAWNERDALWSERTRSLRPRLYRRWSGTLLRAEEQWRGGRELAEIERDTNHVLDELRKELIASQQEVSAPPGYSIYMIRGEGFDAQCDQVSRALQALFIDLAVQTEGLPADKTRPLEQQLYLDFLAQTKKLHDDVLAAASVKYLAARTDPSAAEVILLNRIVKSRQPQPQYTETLLLARLATLATETPAAWPAESIAPLLQLAEQSAHSMTAGPAWAKSRDMLATASRHFHNGEFLLLHPGYAPGDLASQELAAAREAFHKVRSVQAAVSRAYTVFDQALQTLPMLPQRSAANELDPRAWDNAIESTCRFADFLNLASDRPREQSRDLTADTHRFTWDAASVEQFLTIAERPWSDDRLAQLLLAVEEGETTSGQLQIAHCLLRDARWNAADRQALVAAEQTLSRLSHERLGESEPSLSDAQAVIAPIVSRELPLRDCTRRVLHDAHLVQQLSRLGRGDDSDCGEIVACIEKLRKAHDDAATVHSVLRDVRVLLQQHRHRLAQSLADMTGPWQQHRLASVLDCESVLGAVDTAAGSPTVSMRRQAVAERNAWLAEWFAFKRVDDTPVLHTQLARRYAVGGTNADPQIRISGDDSLPRPLRHCPESQAAVVWQLPDNGQIDDYRLLSPSDSLALTGVRHDTATQASLAITVRQIAENARGFDSRGVLLQVEAAGRTWHWPLTFQQPTGSALQLFVSSTEQVETATAAEMRLRPAPLPQTQHLFAANHSDRDLQAVVEIAGVGQATANVPAGGTVPLRFVPAAEAAAGPAPVFTDSLPVRIVDVADPAESRIETIPLHILSPQQYVRIVESRFVPGDNGRNLLRVALAANALPAGPPCLVSLELAPSNIAGLHGVTGGTRQGLLPTDGTPLLLTADGLLLSESLDLQGRFSVSVDGVPQALTLQGTFPRRGDPTSPQQLLAPAIEVVAPEYALAGGGFRPEVNVLSAPAAARLRVRIGQFSGSQLTSELEQIAPHAQLQQVTLTAAKDGSLACHVSQSNWPFEFDTTGILGRRVVQAELLDADDKVLATSRQTVTFDDTPPERAHFFLPPAEALVGTPLPLAVQATDAVSQIDRVYLFAGRPLNDKPPAEAKLIEAKWNAGKSLWEAELPPAKEAEPLTVTAQVVNGVGLSRFVTTEVKIVTELTLAGGEIRGVVLEGPRAQGKLQVQLLDAQGAVLAATTTDPEGRFAFVDLKPGKYMVSSLKEASGRHAQKEVAVKEGAVQSVDSELTL